MSCQIFRRERDSARRRFHRHAPLGRGICFARKSALILPLVGANSFRIPVSLMLITDILWMSCQIFRRERDSNPRDGCPPTRFPSVLLQPLGHLSQKRTAPGRSRPDGAFLDTRLWAGENRFRARVRSSSYSSARFPFDSRQSHKSSAPGRSRTCNLLIRSQTLYPVELRAHRV
jgi:hypothetical protein